MNMHMHFAIELSMLASSEYRNAILKVYIIFFFILNLERKLKREKTLSEDYLALTYFNFVSLKVTRVHECIFQANIPKSPYVTYSLFRSKSENKISISISCNRQSRRSFSVHVYIEIQATMKEIFSFFSYLMKIFLS